MPIASCSNPLSATPECTTVEFIDDILVSYPTNSLAQREDLAGQSLRTSELGTLVNVEIFDRPAGSPDRLRVKPNPNWKNAKNRRGDFNEHQTNATTN